MNAYDKIRKALNTGDSCDLLTAMDALDALEKAASKPVAAMREPTDGEGGMTDITTKLRSLARWLRQLATHEPEPECKASHIECSDDCNEAADEIDRLRAEVVRLREMLYAIVNRCEGQAKDIARAALEPAK